MIVYHAKKVWKNLVSVREYIVQSSITSNRDLQIVYGDQRMTIPKEELQERMFQAHKTEFKSKFGGEKYTLIDFVWKPD